jgi:hypothetical protein
VDGGAGWGDLAAGLARTCTGSLGVHVTASSSQAANINWISGKPTTVTGFSTVAGSSIAFNVQFTMDGLQRVGGSSLAYWQNLSSAYSDTGVSTSSGSLFGSSSLDPASGMTVSFLSPIAAIRLNSTSWVAVL